MFDIILVYLRDTSVRKYHIHQHIRCVVVKDVYMNDFVIEYILCVLKTITHIVLFIQTCSKHNYRL